LPEISSKQTYKSRKVKEVNQVKWKMEIDINPTKKFKDHEINLSNLKDIQGKIKIEPSTKKASNLNLNQNQNQNQKLEDLKTPMIHKRKN